MAKKVKKSEVGVIVDVNQGVTTVTSDVIGSLAVESPTVDSAKKSSSSKKKLSDVVVVADLERKYSELRERYDVSLNSMSALNADNERLGDELDVAVKENKSLHKELSKLRQDYKRVQGDNRANSALVETLNERLAQSVSRNDSLAERTKELLNSLDFKKDENERLCNLLAIRDEEIRKFTTMTFWQRIKFVFLKEKVFDVKA